MVVGYLYDPRLHQEANERQQNYWSVYTAEILDWQGVPSRPVEPGELADEAALAELSALILPRDAAVSLAGRAVDLEKWVRKGGLLIGFMPHDLEDLFGVVSRGVMIQGSDPFTANSTFDWHPHPLTRGVKTPLEPRDPLIMVSDRLLLSRPSDPRAAVLAASSEGPAIVYRRLGRGATLYFAFDLAQTAWAIHQGRPVDRDYDLDGWQYRATDGAISVTKQVKTLQVDEILLVLERILARHRVPSLDRLPPQNGKPSDALFFWGGDDEGSSAGIQVTASKFMKSRGLPYHINVMPTGGTKFGLSLEDAQKVLANGHELSMHPDFVVGWKKPDYSRRDIEKQCKLFMEHYGVQPLVYVAHCLRWCGWSDTPRWLSKLGVIGENNRAGIPTPRGVPNPCDQISLAWGTTFPYHYWDDAAHGNGRIDFVSLPIHMYEVGYQREKNDFTTLHAHLELALAFRLTSNAFYHPGNLTRPGPRRAVDEILRYTKARKANVSQMGCDELAQWWMGRSRSSISVADRDGGIAIRVRTECEPGVTVRIPSSGRKMPPVKVNGRARKPVPGTGIAAGYLMLTLKEGEHEVAVQP